VRYLLTSQTEHPDRVTHVSDLFSPLAIDDRGFTMKVFDWLADCTVEDLLRAEPLAEQAPRSDTTSRAVGDDRAPRAPVSRRRGTPSRTLPPN
jgi:hypothetical protein